ncbi:MAG: hypothetical protein ABI612_12760 [Betaproteobacteria bacterium]
MSRVSYAMVQDFLQVVLMGLVVGVVFSMAITGIVYLLSARADVPDEPGLKADNPGYEAVARAVGGLPLMPEPVAIVGGVQGHNPSN